MNSFRPRTFSTGQWRSRRALLLAASTLALGLLGCGPTEEAAVPTDANAPAANTPAEAGNAPAEGSNAPAEAPSASKGRLMPAAIANKALPPVTTSRV